MIELTTFQFLSILLTALGALFVIGGFVWRLSGRLTKGSEKISSLERRLDKVERVNDGQEDAIKNIDGKVADRFSKVDLKLTRIGTTLGLLYQQITRKESPVNLNGD